jgi:hypothetical protein
MITQPIEVIDTAVKISLGAIVGGVFTYLLERLKQRNERRKEHLRLRQEKIIEPIVMYVDELLVPLSEAYWSYVDQQVESSVTEKIVILRNKEAMIEARVAALNNEELSRRFSEFTQMLFRIRAKLADKKLNSAYEERKKAIELAGNILASLFRLEGRNGA